MVDGWSRALDNLLVFSGLFSAVNTAFIIETYQLLQPDHAEDTANMFRLFLKHRHDTYQFTDEELTFGFSTSPRSAIRTNSIFFASLSCSLLVAIGAVQGKDWLTQYDHNGLAAKPPSAQARVRQKKFDGLEKWRFRIYIAMLPLLLKIALALFMVGVIFFLWEINHEVAGVVVAISLIGLLATVGSWIVAACYSSSPFQTPLSAHVHDPMIRFLAQARNLIHFIANIFSAKILWLRYTLRSWMGQKPGTRWFRSFRTEVSRTLARFKDLNEDSSTEEPIMEKDSKDQISAECVGWLFEQAEHEGVVMRTLNVAALLPPHCVLASFDRRAGLLERLAIRYNSYVAELVGKKKRILEPEETIITGIALFHLLKAQLLTGYRGLSLPISDHRIRSVKSSLTSDDRSGTSPSILPVNSEVQQVLALVICCVEMVLPDSDGAEKAAFRDCFNASAPSFCSATTIFVPTPPTPSSESDPVNVTVFPSGLLLDAVIASAIRHIQSNSWRADWYHYYCIEDLLKILNNALSNDPLEETISHIAIVMAVVQLVRHQGRNHDPLEKNLKDIMAAWYVVDKRATVFTNIVLAFDMAGEIDRDDDDTKQIYLALLRFLDDYLPHEMEVSKKTEWTAWWPNAMNLYPGVLGFLAQIDEKKVPLNDVLRVFARLLPDDWQYTDIQEALLSRHTKEKYPQVHILCPIINNVSHGVPDHGAAVIKLIIQSFNHRCMAPPPIVQDSVVELLGWLVAYPGANDYLPYQVQAHKEYKFIPQFLVSVIEEKEAETHSKSTSLRERNKMICRHAARHLVALAYMDAPRGTTASEVKLKSLIHVFQRWSSISRWAGDKTSETHPSKQFEGGLVLHFVAAPLQRLLEVEPDAEATAHHVRDSALKEIMKRLFGWGTSNPSVAVEAAQDNAEVEK
ncbi:hypothetical protein FRC03_011708 [Tulasnella sp. 419]|nr:hypothetical protein FRC03_011708 [Tulasnella sp. 419]